MAKKDIRAVYGRAIGLAAGRATILDSDGLIGELKKALAERMPNAEMDVHLDGEAQAGLSNHRNGSSPKTVLTPDGVIDLSIPRDRHGRASLPNHARRDSTGICFIGGRGFREFLARYLPARPGPIEDDDGNIVGGHQCLMAYILGQRRGLTIGGRRGARQAPWYVIAKDAARNTLIVAQNIDHPCLLSRRLTTTAFHWIHRPVALSPPPVRAHPPLPTLAKCYASLLAEGCGASEQVSP